MSTFLRGKQAGIEKDLSVNLRPELFAPDDQARYGINSQMSCLAYCPVQSLLAIGTGESKFGTGKIYVFGQRRVQKVLEPPRATTFHDIQFTADHLVSVDSRNELSVWNLDTGGRIASQTIAGHVVSLVTDPMLDWAFIGLQNGEVLAYDLDRLSLVRAFRLPNFWLERDPHTRSAAIVSMALHPRDVGKMLIAYTHGVAIYSFKQNKPVNFLQYTVPQGALGGNGFGTDQIRYPRLTQAVWHPSGTFILTAHEDGSLVFWDPREEKVVMARTLTHFKVDQPESSSEQIHPAEPYTKIAWCCKENCDDSGILIAGGQSPAASPKSMTFIELGQTPVYATATWTALGDYCRGKRQLDLNLPMGAQATDFLLIPRISPHFAGAQDPIAIMSVLSSGELTTMSFPSGYPISPVNQLHPSTFFVAPFITKVNVSGLERNRWLAMFEKRDQGEPILKGGAEGPRPRKRFEDRTIIQAAQADSTIRIWDSGHADEIENGQQIQVDMARALDRYDDIEITAMDMASSSGEFVVGTRTGEAVIFRWGFNKHYQKVQPDHIDPNPMDLTDISSRSEPGLKEGLQPFVLYEMMQGAITAVQISNVGFVGIGSELGFLSIIDLRGPAIIYQAPMTDFSKPEKRSSFFKGSRQSGTEPPKEWPVAIEFSIMTLDDDKYSSICCIVGTNLGKVITFKLLPENDGTYSVKLAGVVNFGDTIISLDAIDAETGKRAAATPAAMSGLREGKQIHGAVVAVTEKEVRIFKPANSKGASKDFDDALCDAATVAEIEMQGFAVVGVFGDQTARAFSIPGLKEIGRADLPMIDPGRRDNTTVTETGDIFAWSGPSEMAVVHVWGAGQPLKQSPDTLINPKLECPPRPTISNMQWISGTQYVSPLDLDLLVGGPDRPPSKRMLDAAAAEKRAAASTSPRYPGSPSSSQEGWGDYLTRQLNERTEKLNIMGDSMDNLQQNSQGWADDVNKYINKQKRNMVMGSLKSKFF